MEKHGENLETAGVAVSNVILEFLLTGGVVLAATDCGLANFLGRRSCAVVQAHGCAVGAGWIGLRFFTERK